MRYYSGLVLLLALFVVWAGNAHASASGLRAQGRYYSAKEAYEQRRYDDAARMLKESRMMLDGKSNKRLQYLLVMSLYNAKRFRDAQEEMNFYLELESDAKGRYMSFPQDVDALTSDETRAITMLIDKIDAEVSAGTEDRLNAAAERESIVSELNGLIWREYVTQTDTAGGKKQPEIANITSSGDYNAWRLVGETSQKRYSDAFDGPARWVIDTEYRRISVTLNLAAITSYRLVTVQPKTVTDSRYGQYRSGNYVEEHGAFSIAKGAAGSATDFLILSFGNLIPYEYRSWDEYDSRGGIRYLDKQHQDYGFSIPITDPAAAKRLMERLLRSNGR